MKGAASGQIAQCVRERAASRQVDGSRPVTTMTAAAAECFEFKRSNSAVIRGSPSTAVFRHILLRCWATWKLWGQHYRSIDFSSSGLFDFKMQLYLLLDSNLQPQEFKVCVHTLLVLRLLVNLYFYSWHCTSNAIFRYYKESINTCQASDLPS